MGSFNMINMNKKVVYWLLPWLVALWYQVMAILIYWNHVSYYNVPPEVQHWRIGCFALGWVTVLLALVFIFFLYVYLFLLYKLRRYAKLISWIVVENLLVLWIYLYITCIFSHFVCRSFGELIICYGGWGRRQNGK